MIVTAARLHQHGQPLSLDEVELGEPGPDEVVVEMAFGGVNPVDRYNALGRVAAEKPLPRTLGSEGSGTLDGRPVVVRGGAGSRREGTWSTKVIVPASTPIDVPAGVDLRAASAMGVAGATAWRTVHELASVGGEDRVLVLGASGGVGSLIVSMCHRIGAAVAAQTANPAKQKWIADRGADTVVVADSERILDALDGYRPTVVFDPLGDGYFGAAVEAMAPGGRLVAFGTSAGPEGNVPLQQLYRKGLRVFGYGGLIEPPEMIASGIAQALAGLAAAQFEVVIDSELPLSQVNAAFERLVDRSVRGKVVLDLAG